MSLPKHHLLTNDRILRLSELDADAFELLILRFLLTRPLLTVNRNGKAISARVAEATTYARSGRKQDGIDVHAKMEGGEAWVFQCKRVKSWSRSQTLKAVADATFAANHFILVLATNPSREVHDEIAKHANWTLWNLDTTCEEIRLCTPPEQLARVLPFLSGDELKRFTPFASEALITHKQFFADRLGTERLFRHDWDLVGRRAELGRLETLLNPEGPRGMVMYSKGGDGKSRLLLEFARNAERTGVPVLFLNPNETADALDFSFVRHDSHFVVVVDDAHRPDPRYIPLLRLAEQEKRVSLVFATRPQGFSPLLSRLIETGLREDFKEFELAPLKRQEIQILAEHSLGPNQQHLAETLTKLTKDSAFLTVLAGDLIQRGRLTTKDWAAEADFRMRVFKEFEEENLHDLSPEQRTLASRVLRVISLLAPAKLDGSFSERVATGLELSALDVDDEIRRLRRVQLLTEDGTRILPDLFSDFLAYDVAVDKKSCQLSLVNAVHRVFPEAASAILRNLAEAAWVGGPPTSDVERMLAPLVDAEFTRFLGFSFYRRAEFLAAWGTYGVYLPSQTIELATMAIANDTAPELEPDATRIIPVPEQMNCHGFIIEKLGDLLKPIALYHERYRTAALDALWKIGKLKPLKRFLNLGPHAWETIGTILKPQAGKPVSVCVAGVEWLARKLELPAERVAASESFGLLNALLGGCFTRFVQFNRQYERTFSWWEQPVRPEDTAALRQRARGILNQIVDQGDWKAAIGVLRTLVDGMRRIVEQRTPIEDIGGFRCAWRDERLEGLELLRRIIIRFPQPAIRYLARAQLLRLIRSEEDSIFRAACRAAVGEIPDDLTSRMTRALVDQGYFEEFDDELQNGSKEMDESRRQWEVKQAGIFEEFTRIHSQADELLDAVAELDAHLREAECSPSLWRFFGHLSRHNTGIASKIATRLVERMPDSPLARAWPMLIESSNYDAPSVVGLERRAIAQPGTEASFAAISILLDRLKQNPELTSEERDLVLDTASRALASELPIFLRILEYGEPKDKSFAKQIIIRLPLEVSSHNDANSILRILSAHCAKDGSDAALVRALLGKLTALEEFDLSQEPDAWDLLTTQYPRELLDFLRDRVELEASGNVSEGYRAFSTFRQVWLDSVKLSEMDDFVQIRQEIWEKVIVDDQYPYRWLQLFQSFGLNDAAWLADRLNFEIDQAHSVERLRWATRFLSFRGSLVIFRQPDLTRRFLSRARDLGGFAEIRSALYTATGPHVTGWINGELNQEDDYVEAEALKASDQHSKDPELHGFFGWIAACEQSRKRRERVEYELQVRDWDEK